MGLERHTFLGMPAVIASESMARVLETARRVARASVAVLITGETGSGKEIVARAIHHFSLRCSKPWVDINCGALPEMLMESELFGHEKGAFSGADTAKAGLFELAHMGTLFLDEIGELDPRMQVKMLRVLDGVPYYRLGSQKKTSVDVRVLAATNQDLLQAAAHGRFRSDLYHRLAEYHIHVPPLRERVDDILPLAEYFLTQHSEQAQFGAEATRRPGIRSARRRMPRIVLEAGSSSRVLFR
jgi:transcriptional regulator with PAS, ATPase and Fis domain